MSCNIAISSVFNLFVNHQMLCYISWGTAVTIPFSFHWFKKSTSQQFLFQDLGIRSGEPDGSTTLLHNKQENESNVCTWNEAMHPRL